MAIFRRGGGTLQLGENKKFLRYILEHVSTHDPQHLSEIGDLSKFLGDFWTCLGGNSFSQRI